MAASYETSFAKTQRTQGFTALLTSAACEWFLIFLLLINTVLSYFLTKFARYCELQAPCIFCSRLEYIFGGGKPEFYQNLLCSSHRSEISSLISCHIHGKVAEGNGMCEDCLLSFTTKAKANQKTHRLLVGKLGFVLGESGFQSSLLSRDLVTASIDSRPCTCCGKVWKSAQNLQKSIQLKSQGRAILKPNIPLPRVPRESRLRHGDSLNKIKDKQVGYTQLKNSFDSLPHGGYTELKLTSDSESEFPFSDDDDVNSVVHEIIEDDSDHVAQSTTVIPPKSLPGDSNLVLNKNSPIFTPSLLDPFVEAEISKQHDLKFPGSGATNGYDLGEINWQQAIQKSPSSDLSKLISLDEVSPSPATVKMSNGKLEESRTDSCLSQNSLPAALSELMTLDGSYSLAEASLEKAAVVTEASDMKSASTEKHEEDPKIITKAGDATEIDLIINNSAFINLRDDNLSNMSKLSLTSKEREVPGNDTEQLSTQEVDRVEEELKQLPSHISLPQGSNSSSIVANHVCHQSEIPAGASSSNGIHVLQKSAPMGSGIESMDVSSISEIEGEPIIDHLKRQIEYDNKCTPMGSGIESMDVSISEIEGEPIIDQLKRQIEYDNKCIRSLHKELEEERNAAAIAANEAMAMITRLQEEKAALHMEALQYLRMMEEQAEYDVDELEKANDLLAEKEKEVQDLEAELELFRLNYMDESTVENMHGESHDLKRGNITEQGVSRACMTDCMGMYSNPKITEVSKVHDETLAAEALSFDFEEEKLYILQSLKSLENKLHQISSDGVSTNMPNGARGNSEDSSTGEAPQLNDEKEETSNGNLTDHDGLDASDSDGYSPSKENNHVASVGIKTSMYKREVDLVSLGNEVSDLNERLEALEADHHLLEHILNSLRNGSDGLQFVRDIAHHLHELRKTRIR